MYITYLNEIILSLLRLDRTKADDGETYELRDPREAELRQTHPGETARAAVDRVLALSGLCPVALRQDGGWKAAVASELHRMMDKGMRAAIKDKARDG